MPELKAAYLIHGDDHGAVAERRAGLRALALAQGDAGSVEVLAGEAATPAGVAQALATLTFATARRVILVDGVERWRQAEVEEHVVPALRAMPPDTTVALFAREEGRDEGARGGARGGEGRQGAGRRAEHRQAVGAAPLGARAGRRASASRSTRRRRGRSWRRSGSASSDSCASWRSWRSSSGPARTPGPSA